MDNGKARTDGLDQRATVRVIQKPTPFTPVRYSSVVQDWSAAAKDHGRFRIVKEFATIPEESTSSEPSRGRELSMGDNASSRISQSDLPVLSVERDDMEMPLSPHHWGRTTPPLDQELRDDEIAPTPQGKRLASQELGHSPTPVLRPTVEPPPLSPAEGFVRKQETESVISGRSRSLLLNSPLPEGQGQDQKEKLAVKKVSSESLSSIASTINTQDVEMTDGDPRSSPPTDDRKQPSFQYKSPVVIIDNTHKSNNVSLTERFLNAANRKRKASVGHFLRSKEPRLESTAAPLNTTPKSTKQPAEKKNAEPNEPSSSTSRKYDRRSSYSGSQGHPSTGERPAELLKTGLGLGITKSPPRTKLVSLKVRTNRGRVAESENAQPSLLPTPNVTTRRRSWSQQNNITPAKGQSPGVEQAKRLSSALRKDSPSDRQLERRSVSFAEDSQSVTTPSITAPRKQNPRPAVSASKDTSNHNVPVSDQGSVDAKQTNAAGIMVFPENVPQERLEQYFSEAAQKFSKIEQEKMEWEKKLKTSEENGDPEHLKLLRDAFSCWTEMTGLANKSKLAGRLNKLRRALAKKEKLLREKEDAMAMSAPLSKPEEDKVKVEGSDSKETPRLDYKSREGKRASKPNGFVATRSASEDGDLPPSVSVRSSEVTTATKLSRLSKPIAQIIARRNIDRTPESFDELIEGSILEPKNDATVEQASQSPSEKSEIINSTRCRQLPLEPSKAEMLQKARSSLRFSSGDLSDHKPSKGISSHVGNGIHNPSSTKQAETLAAGQSKTISASRNQLRSLRDGGISASGSSSSSFPSSSPSLQHRPPQQNGVKSHASLKTLLQAQKAEMERKVPDMERPKQSSAIQPVPREDVYAPPESSTSEDESESEDEKTDSSGDDSRGDIMPTGAASKMRSTR